MSGDTDSWRMFAVYPNQNKIVKLPLGMNDKAGKSEKTADKGGNNDARKKRDTYQVSATKAEDVVSFSLSLGQNFFIS